jgi:hypothetical protein
LLPVALLLPESTGSMPKQQTGRRSASKVAGPDGLQVCATGLASLKDGIHAPLARRSFFNRLFYLRRPSLAQSRRAAIRWQFREQFSHCFRLPAQDELWRDFAQWLQDEPALIRSRMWQGQFRRRAHFASECN